MGSCHQRLTWNSRTHQGQLSVALASNRSGREDAVLEHTQASNNRQYFTDSYRTRPIRRIYDTLNDWSTGHWHGWYSEDGFGPRFITPLGAGVCCCTCTLLTSVCRRQRVSWRLADYGRCVRWPPSLIVYWLVRPARTSSKRRQTHPDQVFVHSTEQTDRWTDAQASGWRCSCSRTSVRISRCLPGGHRRWCGSGTEPSPGTCRHHRLSVGRQRSWDRCSTDWPATLWSGLTERRSCLQSNHHHLVVYKFIMRLLHNEYDTIRCGRLTCAQNLTRWPA